MNVLIEWVGEPGWQRFGESHYVMRPGKRVHIDEEDFDEKVMVKVSDDGSADVSASSEAVAEEVEFEAAVADAPGDAGDSGDEESDSEEGLEADGSEEPEVLSDAEVKALKRVDLHAYARAQGVDPEGKRMDEIQEELGVE